MAAVAKLLRSADRRRTGRFLAEGPNLVGAAVRRGLVEEVFATPDAAERHGDLFAGLPTHAITDAAAKKLSETVTPPGLVAVCRVPHADLDDILGAQPALLVVAVGLSEPGNAGTVIRTADAMGADAVVFAGHGVDPYNGKSLRASAGSIFALPVLATPELSSAELLGRLRAAGLVVLATTPDGELSLDDAQGVLAKPAAWIFGSESHGLPREIVAGADHRVMIPMSGGAESVNVAAAAAICLYMTARAHRVREP